MAIQAHLPKRVGWPCLVRSALKRTPVQGFNSFSIMFYYIISITYQKIGDLFWPHIFLNFCTVCQVNIFYYLEPRLQWASSKHRSSEEVFANFFIKVLKLHKGLHIVTLFLCSHTAAVFLYSPQDFRSIWLAMRS